MFGGIYDYQLLEIIKEGANCKIVSCDGTDKSFDKLYQTDFVLTKDSKDGWYNYYREDDFSSTAYFYYNKPYSDLPSLCSVDKRY